MPSSKGSSQPREQTQVSQISGGFFTIWATREAPRKAYGATKETKQKKFGSEVLVRWGHGSPLRKKLCNTPCKKGWWRQWEQRERRHILGIFWHQESLQRQIRGWRRWWNYGQIRNFNASERQNSRTCREVHAVTDWGDCKTWWCNVREYSEGHSLHLFNAHASLSPGYLPNAFFKVTRQRGLRLRKGTLKSSMCKSEVTLGQWVPFWRAWKGHRKTKPRWYPGVHVKTHGRKEGVSRLGEGLKGSQNWKDFWRALGLHW